MNSYRSLPTWAPRVKAHLIQRLYENDAHGFHHFLTSGRTRRPVGVTLIDGNIEFVVYFLDQLTYGAGSAPGLQQHHAEWREKIATQPHKKRK